MKRLKQKNQRVNPLGLFSYPDADALTPFEGKQFSPDWMTDEARRKGIVRIGSAYVQIQAWAGANTIEEEDEDEEAGIVTED